MLDDTSTAAAPFVVYLIGMLAIGYWSYMRADNLSDSVFEADLWRHN